MHRGWLALTAFTAGCIAVPVALPPAKPSLGLGVAFGNPLPDRVDGRPLSEAEPMVAGRVGVTPLTLVPGLHRRPLDVSVGYAFHVFTNELRQNRNRHGISVGLDLLLGDFWLGRGWRARVVLRGSAEYFVQQAHPGDGGGGSWAVGFEASIPTRHENDELGFGLFGLAMGEWALGAEVFAGAHSIGGYEYGTFGVALTGRWPGVLGLAVVPLLGVF